jgi:1-phosphatidylinositol-4-phosphate 5-kinase
MISREKDISIFHSFNINLNINLVKEKSFINGGKSGEFFFSTYDYKFIIKTISFGEAKLYKQKITHFYQYFNDNPKTLIAKIFGLYELKRTDIIEKAIFLILMRNICPYSQELRERAYDIKGSSFNRCAMKEQNIGDNQ